MKKRLEIHQKQESNPTSYKEKYEQLKELLNKVHQHLETSYKPSPEKLLIDASELDSKLSKNEINRKQAYFNLLDTCYERAKKNSLCIFLKFEPEQFVEQNLTNDIILRNELPKEVKKGEENVSILTPDGLYQYNPHDNALFRQILTKDELKQIGFQDYLAKAENAKLETKNSIKEELIQNQLIYDLDEEINKKHSNVYLRRVKFHTCFLVASSDKAEEQLREKAESSKPKRENNSLADEFFSALRSNLQNGFQSPAPKGLNGLMQITCSFKGDFYEQFNLRDRFLVELMDSIDFLGEEKIRSYKENIKKDTDFEKDVKNLIQEIVIDVYNHSKDHPNDKKECYELINRYLVSRRGGADEYEIYKEYFKDIPITKEQYIDYTMDQWIEDRKNTNITKNTSFYENMLSLLKPRLFDELNDFKYNAKQNSTALQKETNIVPFFEIEEDQVRSYCRIQPSKESTAFKELLNKHNPVIVKAIYEKYQDSKTTAETKIKLRQFLLDLDKFESEVNKLQLQVELFKDSQIANATKSQYCNTLRANVETTRSTLSQQHDKLKVQLEDIFAKEIKSGKSKAVGAGLMILGAALVVVGVALAVFVAPLGAIAIAPGLGLLVAGGGLFKKGSNPISKQAQQMVSEVYEQGEEAIKSIESHKEIKEPKVKRVFI